MYDISSILIAVSPCASKLVAIELTLGIGARSQAVAADPSRTHIDAIQASRLGVLALLLGFTFSLSLQRNR